jgi:hypothetical protein
MIHLIFFSLKRRFFNRMALILNTLTLTVILVIANADHIAAALNLDLGKLTPIGVNESTRSTLLDEQSWESAGFTLVKDAPITITWVDDHYEVYGAHDPLTQNGIAQQLLKSHQLRILLSSDPSLEAFMVKFSTVEVAFDPPWDPIAALRDNLLFSILTAVYFMILNFIAVNSGEVMAEKTSNVLELILSRLKPHHHFVAKLVTGVSSLVIQLLLSGGMVGLVVVARWRSDRFVGLIRFMIRLFKLNPEVINQEIVMQLLTPSVDLLVRFLMAFGILMLGMSLLLVLILIVSSRVKSAEEASMIQGPFYLGLLALYYVSLGVMNPVSLNTGMGQTLSLMPLGSMLVMGMRIIHGSVSAAEVGLSVVGSVVALVGVILVGYPWYRRGLTQG